jgi:hypothetical protein
MQESCSYGSVGERGGNDPLYPEDQKSEVRDQKHRQPTTDHWQPPLTMPYK